MSKGNERPKIDDFFRLVDLIRISAETLKLYSETTSGDGELSRITELAQRIDVIADELVVAGKALRN